MVGLQELTQRANELTVTVYRPLEIYTVLVAEYLVLILAAAWAVRRLERKMVHAPLTAQAASIPKNLIRTLPPLKIATTFSPL